MVRRLISLFAVTTLIAGFGTFLLSPPPANALFEAAETEACKGVNLSSDSGIDEKCTEGAETKANNLIAIIINLLSIIIGIIAVVVLIISGLRMITSGGDSNGVASARNGIIYAIVGLIIVAFAQFIVKFVLSKV